MRYELACWEASQGNREAALEQLREAISLQPEAAESARDDEDFAELRGDAEFAELTGG